MSERPNTAEKKLRKCIKSLLVLNHKDQKFLPADEAARLTTHESVVDGLRGTLSNEDDVQWLADYVVAESAKTLYLLLANIKSLDALLQLARHGYSDADLPVYSTSRSLISVNWTEGSGKPEFWPVVDEWDFGDRDLFSLRQWMFLTPVFAPEKFHHELEGNTIMPFKTLQSHGDGGHYSSVYEVTVHGAHQTVFPSTRTGKAFKAALKEIQKGSDAFAQEKEFLEIVRLVEHRHLITPLASFTHHPVGEGGSFLFPWAEGGNLAQAWRGDKLSDGAARSGNRNLAHWALAQIHGLCGALEALHLKEGRHGDIKPENILLFHDSEDNPGTLQIADFGLGRFHANVTSERKRREQKTRTGTATSRYIPPEFVLNIGQQLPRSQDVWSLGCVFLEFVAWVLTGSQGLDEFGTGRMQHFWQDNGPTQPRSLHRTARAVIDDLKRALGGDGLPPAAFYDVLELVEARMLVPEQERWKCDQLMARLDDIYERAKIDQEYLIDLSIGLRMENATAKASAEAQDMADGASVETSSIGVPEIRISDETGQDQGLFPSGLKSGVFKPTKKDPPQFGPHSGDRWATEADNTFVHSLFKVEGWPLAPRLQTHVLCGRCTAVDLWAEDLVIESSPRELIESSQCCDLCKLLAVSMKQHRPPEDKQLRITRVGSSLVIDPTYLPILSIYVDPENASHVTLGAQIGTPVLPEPASKHHFELMKAWISTCEASHHHTGTKTGLSIDDRPSRVIDVGNTAQPSLRLIEGKNMMTQDYVAMSHCWGPQKDLHFGKTTLSNYAARQTSIDPVELPLNFRDAIEVTRGLDVRYLWIDSLCIIQGNKEDWDRESVRMEQVYSNAQCVLAASSAERTTDGFLRHTRKPREFVTMMSSTGMRSYLCENIDNFKQDVEQAVLNTRGWVLQERALARRTIHFAATQTYFECGDGKRCESLMRLSNEKSATLGDSDFPKSAEGFYRGERIMLIQNLYELYSTLEFNEPTDRPIGISGLEKRVAAAFQTRGGYGVFEKYLMRNLLWKGATRGGLKPIDFSSPFSKTRKVPSWSWMAYSGPISYVQIDFAKAQWTDEVKSPFDTSSGDNGKEHWNANGSHDPPVLVLSKVRRLATTLQATDLSIKVTFDCHDAFNRQTNELRCVVLGKHQPGIDLGSASYYVLIVTETNETTALATAIYKRLGAGELRENQIDWDSFDNGELH